MASNNEYEQQQFWNEQMNKAQEAFINEMYRPKFKELLSCLTDNQPNSIGQKKYEWSLIRNYKLHTNGR